MSIGRSLRSGLLKPRAHAVFVVQRTRVYAELLLIGFGAVYSQVVSFDHWLTIDKHEQATGELKSKPREKVTTTAEMFKLAGF